VVPTVYLYIPAISIRPIDTPASSLKREPRLVSILFAQVLLFSVPMQRELVSPVRYRNFLRDWRRRKGLARRTP